MVIIQFILAHKAALSAVGGILLQEFIANNSKIQGNSLGQLAVAWLKGFFQKNAQA